MRSILLALTAILAAAGSQAAGPVDHERARAAMEAGEIMPLHDILLKVDNKFVGRVLDAKLTEFDAGLQGWIYAITFLTPQDNVLVLKVDAGTGVILQIEGHGIDEARKPQ
jgi:uncharacterized membrane protein YkoI